MQKAQRQIKFGRDGPTLNCHSEANGNDKRFWEDLMMCGPEPEIHKYVPHVKKPCEDRTAMIRKKVMNTMIPYKHLAVPK